MPDLLFGGTPLVAAHFESDVAKAVFNDKGGPPVTGFKLAIETRTFELLKRASPKVIMRWSAQLDLLIVPWLSPAGFRDFCCFLCEHLPQAIENMPHTRESVLALSRAVHLAKFINPGSMDRIQKALHREGLAR